MLEFGQISISSKDFYKTYQVPESIDMEKITISDAVTANKIDTRRTIGYEVEPGKVIPLFIKTPKNCSSNGVTRYNENSAWKMGFRVGDEQAWVEQYEAIWARIEELIFEKLAGSLLSNGQFINPKLIAWESDIKTQFHGQCVPYSRHCEATGVLKIGSVYQQGKNHHFQVFLKECKYKETDADFQSQLSDDDSGFDTVW